MSSAWVLRPYPDGKYKMDEFKCNNFIAIGFPHLGDLSGKDRDAIKKAFIVHYSYSSNQSLGQAVGVVDKFVNWMKIGDYVVVPDGPNVYIGIIKSDYKYEASKDNDIEGYPHQRDVEWIYDKRSIPRSALTGRLFDSLKGQQTLFETYYDDIDDIVENKKYLFVNQDYIDLKKEYLKRLQEGTLLGVNSSSFEEAVRIVLERSYPGIHRLPTTNSKQGDTDLMTTLPGNINIRVQVKHFYPEYGELQSWVVDQLAASMADGDIGIIVTSGTISDDAIRHAEEYNSKCKRISFINGAEFVDLVFNNIDLFTDEELRHLGLTRTVKLL